VHRDDGAVFEPEACDLVRDEAGVRLAKRHDALSLRNLREQGYGPQQVLNMCAPR